MESLKSKTSVALLSIVVFTGCSDVNFLGNQSSSDKNDNATSTFTAGATTNSSANSMPGGGTGNGGNATSTSNQTGINTSTGTSAQDGGINMGKGIDCRVERPGLNGLIYRLPAPHNDSNPAVRPRRLPTASEYAGWTPVGQLTATTLDVPNRRWEQGFPSVAADLQEFFSVVFVGSILVPETKSYIFRMNSDDGSKLYIDGNVVLDHDGDHVAYDKYSGATQLSAGKHPIKIEWYQGPRYNLALQLSWNASGGFSIIPSDKLSHIKDCNLVDVGEFNSLGR